MTNYKMIFAFECQLYFFVFHFIVSHGNIIISSEGLHNNVLSCIFAENMVGLKLFDWIKSKKYSN